MKTYCYNLFTCLSIDWRHCLVVVTLIMRSLARQKFIGNYQLKDFSKTLWHLLSSLLFYHSTINSRLTGFSNKLKNTYYFVKQRHKRISFDNLHKLTYPQNKLISLCWYSLKYMYTRPFTENNVMILLNKIEIPPSPHFYFLASH